MPASAAAGVGYQFLIYDESFRDALVASYNGTAALSSSDPLAILPVLAPPIVEDTFPGTPGTLLKSTAPDSGSATFWSAAVGSNTFELTAGGAEHTGTSSELLAGDCGLSDAVQVSVILSTLQAAAHGGGNFLGVAMGMTDADNGFLVYFRNDADFGANFEVRERKTGTEYVVYAITFALSGDTQLKIQSWIAGTALYFQIVGVQTGTIYESSAIDTTSLAGSGGVDPGPGLSTKMGLFANCASGVFSDFRIDSTPVTLGCTFHNGIGTFSATLATVGTQTITGTDTTTASLTGTITVSVFDASTYFSVAFTGGSSYNAGDAIEFTVTSANPSYAGTVFLTSSDTQAVLPANATLTSGVGTFTATLKTAGLQTLTAHDSVTSTIQGTSPDATIAPSAAASLILTPDVIAAVSTTAGDGFGLTVTAVDVYNNQDTNYAGTVTFSTGASAHFVNLVCSGGTGSTIGTLNTAGLQTVTGTDTVTSAITGNVSIRVVAGTCTQFAITSSGSGTVGDAQSVTVQAQDANGNNTTLYAGTVHFTAPTDTHSPILPANSTLTSGRGIFAATFKTSNFESFGGLIATDTVTSSILGSTFISMLPKGIDHFSWVTPATVTHNVGSAVTCSAVDVYGNRAYAGGPYALNYVGTVHFSSDDGAAVLPSNTTLTNARLVFSATLKTVGTKHVTATDTTTATLSGTSSGIVVI